MTRKFKTALDAVRAEDKLKSDTTQFLYSAIQKRGMTQSRTALRACLVSFIRRSFGRIYDPPRQNPHESIKDSFRFFLAAHQIRRNIPSAKDTKQALRKYAAAFVCVAALILSSAFTYNVYITPVAYVDVDVNPSVELALNMFDRVIGANAFNDDGVNIFDDVSVKHKSYGDAITLLLDTIAEQGYLPNGGLVSVTLQTDDADRENVLLENIQYGIDNYMTERCHTAQIDVFPVSGDIRNESNEQGVSPAKYLAIQELIGVDPTATVEKCRRHSISEIKQMIRTNGGYHDNAEDNDSTPTQNEVQHGGCHDNGHNGCGHS